MNDLKKLPAIFIGQGICGRCLLLQTIIGIGNNKCNPCCKCGWPNFAEVIIIKSRADKRIIGNGKVGQSSTRSVLCIINNK